MATFLPDDLMFLEILTRLPAKSLMRFKCVSKTWKTLISGDPYFITAHQRQHNSEDNPLVIIRYDHIFQEEEEEVKYVEQSAKLLSEQCSTASDVDISDLVRECGPVRFTSSCEGLICVMCEELPKRVVLWNPATQQRRQLPRPSGDNEFLTVGIGMDNRSGDWKVVRLCVDQPNVWVRAHVFDKSSATWRDCGASGITGDIPCSLHPLAAAGALHWQWSTGPSRDILSFDLDNEVLRSLNGPDCGCFRLCKWRSSLAALVCDFVDYHTRLWYLTVSSPSSDGGGSTWNKLLKFTPSFSEIYLNGFRFGYCDPDFTMPSNDPETPDEVRKLKQFCLHDDFIDYAITIKSVF